ncbi:MAG: transporter, partial [Bacteroidales bacterium]
MKRIIDLIMGTAVAHSIILMAATIAIGLLLGKVKIRGISLGVTWVLFVGILASHFGLVLDPKVQSFVQDFGLVLFVYAIGLQVGPTFFSSFKKGGLKLNFLAVIIIALEVGVTYAMSALSGVKLNTMIGVMSGAVTNTPSLGAAQQTIADATGAADPTLAMGYAVAYPMGVLGVIIVMLILKGLFKANPAKEAAAGQALEQDAAKPMQSAAGSIVQ